jgi:hypothetical protein
MASNCLQRSQSRSQSGVLHTGKTVLRATFLFLILYNLLVPRSVYRLSEQSKAVWHRMR